MIYLGYHSDAAEWYGNDCMCPENRQSWAILQEKSVKCKRICDQIRKAAYLCGLLISCKMLLTAKLMKVKLNNNFKI